MMSLLGLKRAEFEVSKHYSDAEEICAYVGWRCGSSLRFLVLSQCQYKKKKTDKQDRTEVRRTAWTKLYVGSILDKPGHKVKSIKNIVKLGLTERIHCRKFSVSRHNTEIMWLRYIHRCYINPLNAELNPICHLLALLGAHHILHVSRISVNGDVSRTTTM